MQHSQMIAIVCPFSPRLEKIKPDVWRLVLFGIMGTALKILDIIVLWYTNDFRGVLNWATMIPRDVSISGGCTSERCSNSNVFVLAFCHSSSRHDSTYSSCSRRPIKHMFRQARISTMIKRNSRLHGTQLWILLKPPPTLEQYCTDGFEVEPE